MTHLGRTRLYTRRDRLRRAAGVTAALAGVPVAVAVGAAVVSWCGGHGWSTLHLTPRSPFSGGTGLLGLPHDGRTITSTHLRLPVVVRWPGSPIWSLIVATPLWIGWIMVTAWPLLAGLRRPDRWLGMASPRAIRRQLGAHQARRAGRFTLPTLGWYRRLVLPTRAFGFTLGRPRVPRLRRRLWADWEQRIRLVARVGWGKTKRLLIPLIRHAPGAVLVSSTEPDIFTHTVAARQRRRPPLRWPWLTWLCRRWLPARDYPVLALDFSAPAVRFTSGYPQLHHNPIDGSREFAIAHRQAVSLVGGVESARPSERGSSDDKFFRDSAAEVLAAWLHAADLGDKEIDDMAEWQRRPDDPMPRRILRDDPRADPSAATNLDTHLDRRAQRTTSGVARFITLATNSLFSTEGRALCGQRFVHGVRQSHADLAALIRQEGTLYLLADNARVERSRPLLSLVASEFFLAAEQVALAHPRRRLPRPCIGFLDELRYAITVSNLPYVASAQRKYNITYLYSVQSSSQEDQVYGADAQALRDAAGVTVIGGLDITSAQELSDRAGTISVVSATRGPSEPGEHIQHQDVLTIRDQQQLADGDAVIVARGVVPFIAAMPHLNQHRWRNRRVLREAATVSRRVAAARAGELAALDHQQTAAAWGARFTPTDDQD